MYYLKVVFRIQKTHLFSSETSVPHVHSLCAVLQPCPIHFNRVKLQYQTQPMHWCGAVSERKQSCFSNTVRPL